MRRLDRGIILSWVALCALAVLYALIVATAVGQRRPDPALLLARSCVSERGWRVETDDCAAIAEVVRARSERTGEPFVEAIGELAPHLHGEDPLPRRRWLQHLDVDGARPRHWPRSASWERHAPAWQATLDEARALLAGERPSPCERTPSAWGSADDVRRRAALGRRRWVEIDCGDTRNRFGEWRAAR